MIERASLAGLEATLSLMGLSVEALRSRTSALVLFGSRAAGCARPSSDWDLLCVGRMNPIKTPAIDIVSIPEGALSTDLWVGRELAGHVLEYGIWLHGAPLWCAADLRFDLAAKGKIARITRRLCALDGVWGSLRKAYRDKHARLIRRDVQRADLLSRGRPIPPAAVLDEAWRAAAYPAVWLAERLVRLGARSDVAESLAQSRCHGWADSPGSTPP